VQFKIRLSSLESTMFASHQYHYQQAGGTAVSTGGMVWNGTAWVSSAAAGHVVTPHSRSTYSTTAAYGVAPAPAVVAAVETPAVKVAKYTQYYHQWTARVKEYEQHLERLPLTSVERVEAQRNADWAKYYADQSSRAAHHFHNHPLNPAPFELPPEPQPLAQPQQPQHVPVADKLESAQVTGTKAGSRWSSQSTNPVQSSSSSQGRGGGGSGGPPDSLKRYVHRCLENCKTPEQQKAIQSETERVIAKALQEGTLHTKNWDNETLIPVPGVTEVSRKQPSSYNENQQNAPSKKPKLSSNDLYYGPTSSSGGDSPKSYSTQDRSHGGTQYGPNASPTNPAATSQYSFYQPQQQQSISKYQNHYGPGAADDFIAVPQLGKNGPKKNKYVNPNSIKKKKQSMGDEGFQRSSTTLADRANRFSGPGGNNDVRHATAKGIDARYMGKGVIGGSQKKLDETDYEQMKVKGTCQVLEKDYLRLTAPPKAELVRPLEILQQHLKNLKDEWKSVSRRDYNFFCSQMKSLRQDLTVQHIQNAFTVDVYETHARMALQEGDMNEFNQSQTQLKILYDKLTDPKALENENEFVAYRMIYFVVMSLNKGYKGGSSDLLKLMLSLTPEQRKNRAIKHSLQLRAAVAEMDYHKFFQLQAACPNLGDRLISRAAPIVKHLALQRICRAYRPTVEVEFALKELGFSVDTSDDMKDGKTYLLSCGCVLSEDGTQIDAKETTVRESDLEEKRSLN
jgi:SAC3 family protein LENG8/THP3